jgi:hypothetical protein
VRAFRPYPFGPLNATPRLAFTSPLLPGPNDHRLSQAQTTRFFVLALVPDWGLELRGYLFAVFRRALVLDLDLGTTR